MKKSNKPARYGLLHRISGSVSEISKYQIQLKKWWLDIILELTLAGPSSSCGWPLAPYILPTEIKHAVGPGMTCHLNVIVMDHVTREDGSKKVRRCSAGAAGLDRFYSLKVNNEKSQVERGGTSFQGK